MVRESWPVRARGGRLDRNLQTLVRQSGTCASLFLDGSASKSLSANEIHDGKVLKLLTPKDRAGYSWIDENVQLSRCQRRPFDFEDQFGEIRRIGGESPNRSTEEIAWM